MSYNITIDSGESFDFASVEGQLALGIIAHEYKIPTEKVRKEIEISMEILDGKRSATAEESFKSEEKLSYLKEKLSFISEIKKFNFVVNRAIIQAAEAHILSPKELIHALTDEETTPFSTKIRWLVAIQTELEFLKQRNWQPIEQELGLA